ncbi:hypothetical protein N7466_005770 [Penicillium verhagenii]|uniref:uncharacterized protein n=1 Tax=Penicillium verhagenii TaxID=1562060 RepID=UPI002544D4DF|nr:uncharacterized protein N7466_005770 [Penicillium verhagenii]KAJ5930277.1 hypothetical protein N7466_005770 [Penicillium verhagenii]
MAPKYKLSDSESEAEPDVSSTPSNKQIEQALRDEVAGVYKSGNLEELTMKRVRLAVEKKLGLTEGYFRSTADLKARSEQIIKAEVDVQENEPDAEAEPAQKTPSPSPPPKPQPKNTALPKRSKSESAPKPRKRQKTRTPVSDDENEEVTAQSDNDSEKEVTKPDIAESDGSGGEQDSGAVKSSEVVKEDSESEMSVVLDEEPKPKRQRRKSTEASSKKEKKKPAPKAKPKSKDEDNPDHAEIKRLQGWLVKCGIRKMWFRELAPYDTAKAKIKHLKGMLEGAGMTGRYSQEKANQIREERELKADLEQIQQGAKQWGKDSGDAEEDEGPPRRRAAARGRQALAFLESDGEESD